MALESLSRFTFDSTSQQVSNIKQITLPFFNFTSIVLNTFVQKICFTHQKQKPTQRTHHSTERSLVPCNGVLQSTPSRLPQKRAERVSFCLQLSRAVLGWDVSISRLLGQAPPIWTCSGFLVPRLTSSLLLTHFSSDMLHISLGVGDAWSLLDDFKLSKNPGAYFKV